MYMATPPGVTVLSENVEDDPPANTVMVAGASLAMSI
jgi:hypothetical protein